VTSPSVPAGGSRRLSRSELELGLLKRWPSWIVSVLSAGGWLEAAWGRMPGWPETAAGMLGLASLVYASVRLDSQGFMTAVVRGPGHNRRVALTFDDGPDPAGTAKVLGALGRYGARATFFVLGAKAQRFGDLVRRLRAEGHEVGSHGYGHRWQSLLTVSAAARSLDRAQQAIAGALGEAPRLFRPPFGVMTPSLAIAAQRMGVRVVGWSVRGWDTVRQSAADAHATRLSARLVPGDIVLLHDGPQRLGGRSPLGPSLVEPLLALLSQERWSMVTVSELLGS
jgi:peptidoglycan/xylan/chitin deacetylase (PgdA/CDA1 family)